MPQTASASGEVERYTRPSDPAVEHARAVLDELLGPPHTRPFDVQWWDGTLDSGAGEQGAAPFTLVVARPGALRRLLLPPSEVAITDAYIFGDLDIEGDLEAAAILGDLMSSRLRGGARVSRILRHLLRLPRDARDESLARRVRGLLRRGRRHTVERDAHAVRFHYDLGNDFYALFLDARMVYSCAYFERDDETLEAAQEAKLEHVCRKLRLAPGMRLLDIGCGWGALIIHAARHHGVTAYGITLSEEQAREARARIDRLGLEARCRVEVRDYRTLGAREADRFDRVASIGMVEHVGEARLDDYFAAAWRCLEPRGLFLNHGIVSLKAARPKSFRSKVEHRLWGRDKFIDRYVFPDARLYPLAPLIASAERVGFEVRDVESLREHYALTLRHWVRRLERAEERAIGLVGEPTYRVWRLYMAAAALGFARARNNVVQTLLVKSTAGGGSGMPRTRRELYR